MKSAHVGAFLLALGSALMLPAPAAAQLGLGVGELIVTMTSPANGSTVSGTVPVSASVTIIGGLIVRDVQFRLDGASLGSPDTSAPYSIAWDTRTATNGTHTLTAVARDLLGLTFSSNPITVTVFNDKAPPTIAISAPAAGEVLHGSVAVSASAADNVGVAGVQFRLNGTNLGAEDTAAPYSVTWNSTTASDGSHVLTAVARDTAGNAATSAAITVTVDNAPPTVAITAPAAGATVGGTVTVTASASDNGAVAGVQFTLDGANLGAEDTAAPYSVAWDTTIAADGSHTLTAVARDAAGSTRTSAPVTVTVSNVTETVTRIEDTSTSITYAGSWALGNTAKAWSGGTAALATGGPSATGEPTRATLTFTGTAVRWIGFRGPQTGIARVYLDGALVATVDTYAPTEAVEALLYTATGLAATSHTVAVESTGTKNSSSVDIYVVVDAFDVTATSGGGGSDTTPPAVAITTPSSGSTATGTIIVSATASDAGGIAGVQFLLDGTPLQPADTAAPYSINWDTTTASDGSHTLSAVARDTAGNTATSAPVPVAVANGSAPPPSTSTLTRFENTSPSITYAAGTTAPDRPGVWWHGSRSRAWSDKTSSFNRSAGARATFRFTGTEARWIGFRAPWAGIARVYVDGAFIREIDLYSPTEHVQGIVFAAAGLPLGSHTLTVESTGRKHGGDTCDSAAPACAADWAVVVDAFDVAPASALPPTGTRFEETASTVYAGPWSAPQVAATPSWSGGAAVSSTTPSARATFTFIGTEVRWVGLRGPENGIARVFLDGTLQATIDTYSPTEIHAVVFAATSLAPATHELTIEVTGERHAAATGSAIVIDAFDVRSRFEDDNASVAYSSTGWARENHDRAWSGESANIGGGTAAFSATAGSSAAFTFTGTEVRWIGYRGPLAGIAEVSVDGGAPTTLDLYAPVEEIGAVVFERTGLAGGQHTLTIRATGQRTASATNALVVVDAFDVKLPSSAPRIARFQETDPAASYTPEWVQPDGLSFHSGGGIKGAEKVGARATFTFTGTGIRWIGRRFTDTGVARVYMDGVPVAVVDTRSAIQEEFQAPVFSTTGLPPGTHTLAIEVVGRNGEAAGLTVPPVWVDAFDVFQ